MSSNVQPHPISATVLGYPRIGRRRELKWATEGFWTGAVSGDELRATGVTLRRETWRTLRAAGITEVPVNDFSFYDHVADMIQLLGAVPERHQVARPTSMTSTESHRPELDEYFAMARGTATAAPLEMTKWFDTNYHFLIPELRPDTAFRLNADKPVVEVGEARRLGLQPRPVLLGPVTFLQLAKRAPGVASEFGPLDLLPRLLPVYRELLARLAEAGAPWVQIDEPILIADPAAQVLQAARDAFEYLSASSSRPRLLIATYFGAADTALPLLRAAPVDGVALDFTESSRRNLDLLTAGGGLPGKRLVAGLVDGRNVWINDLARSISTVQELKGQANELVVSTSSSLLHVPLDIEQESHLPSTVRSWLAFAEQKLIEVVTVARLASGGFDANPHVVANQRRLAARRRDPSAHVDAVRDRVAAITAQDLRRHHHGTDRVAVQRSRLDLPLLPTTTIGSFPQTPELRTARARLRRASITVEQYERLVGAEIDHVIALQEEIGLDVLVHGEPERNDMVQYFAEQLDGFVVTEQGWVQSYGTRCVRPPILAGDVSRTKPMTVRWTTHAQRLTRLPVKGMLTGPVTMLAWSFVRDDQPIVETARQVALVLRDEICDLERSGIAIIQVDEPGLRETLPLQAVARPAYLRWAVDAFRLATAGVRDDTQIHTHMCYADFDDILDAIAELDVDVISLEAARSHTHARWNLRQPGVSYGLGPGVYDIHAPRVPAAAEIAGLLREAVKHVPASRLWVNPDCGLKTRTEAQVTEALGNMVTAAREVRAEMADDRRRLAVRRTRWPRRAGST